MRGADFRIRDGSQIVGQSLLFFEHGHGNILPYCAPAIQNIIRLLGPFVQPGAALNSA
jgi:hypothetical protein